MIYRGICWGIIISIPFWLLVIWLIKAGFIAVNTLIIAGLILSAPYIFLITRSRQNTEQDKQVEALEPVDENNDSTISVQSTNHRRKSSETGTPD